VLTATYNGDGNYATSTAGGGFQSQYTTSGVLTANTSSPNAGDSVTLTALFSSASTTGPALSGGVSFSSNQVSLPGTPTITTITDGTGHPALQATLTYTPTANHQTVFAGYSGDINYLNSGTNPVFIVVAGSDFTLTATNTSPAVNAGSSTSTDLTIDGQASYAGTINFSASSCTGLPAETTCSFSVPSVVGSGSTTLTIQTTGPHTVAYEPHTRTRFSLTLAFGMGFMGIVVLGNLSRRRRNVMLTMAGVILLIALTSCGGGSSGGGGGGGGHTDPGTPHGTSTVTVTAGDGTHTHTLTLNFTVQ